MQIQHGLPSVTLDSDFRERSNNYEGKDGLDGKRKTVSACISSLPQEKSWPTKSHKATFLLNGPDDGMGGGESSCSISARSVHHCDRK